MNYTERYRSNLKRNGRIRFQLTTFVENEDKIRRYAKRLDKKVERGIVKIKTDCQD